MMITSSELSTIQNLDSLIIERLSNSSAYPKSSTVILASEGIVGMAVKVGEETGELIQAVIAENDKSVLNEAQQLLYMTAVSIALSCTAGGLAASLELANYQKEPHIGTRNEVVKNLGRSAAGFSFALGANNKLLEAGASLVFSIDAAVCFRQLLLAQVIERI